MIQVELSAAEIPIEPGDTAQLTATITNRQDHDDHVFIEIEGIDVEWYALPVPAVNIPAGGTESARILFKIARASESHAGSYPFLVRARGMESGVSGVQQATLVIKPFNALQVELNPRRVAATFFKHDNVVDVTVSNLGNREETLELYASDPEDACAYEFENDRVTVKPGHSQTVPLHVEPVTRPVIGSGRLHSFAVTARSVEDSYISGTAHGQLEKHPLFSTLMAAVLLLLFVSATGLALFWPRPPAPPLIHSFVANPTQVIEGGETTLAWDASHVGERSVILPDNLPVTQGVGTVKVRPTNPSTTYTLVVRNGNNEKRQDVTVAVTPKPTSPKPRIVKFDVTQRRIHQGDSVTLSWTLENANRVLLNPLGKESDYPLYTSQEIKPEQTTTFVLGAQGPGGLAQKSVKVEVVPPNASLAVINDFKARPEKIEAGKKSTLTWSVDNATTIEIDNGVGGGLSKKGKFEVSPAQTTVYTLHAADNRGNITTRTVTVTVTEPAITTPTQNPTEPGTNPPTSTPPPPNSPGAPH